MDYGMIILYVITKTCKLFDMQSSFILESKNDLECDQINTYSILFAFQTDLIQNTLIINNIFNHKIDDNYIELEYNQKINDLLIEKLFF